MTRILEKDYDSEKGRKMNPWIGTDESGKGDYFGGLSVAAVYVTESTLLKLKSFDIRDSKRISDAVIRELAISIKKNCINSIVYIGPEKYNELYTKIRNLNRLLAWGHARAIENILEKVDCKNVKTDQFGDKRFVLNALMKKGKQITLEQRPKAEDDIAVAAASILARDEFLMRIEQLGEKIGIELPKGASSLVEEKARLIVKEKGKDILTRIAKLHFKTTEKVGVGGLGFQPVEKDSDTNRSPTSCATVSRLWAPWRMEYINISKDPGCIFCKAIKSADDRKSYILKKTEKAFCIMNIFPYNNGHLMVAPKRHIGEIEKLDKTELMEMMQLVQESIQVLKEVFNTDGFNVGMNLGKLAGAGVEGHIHIHIVPRWTGDTNFMPIIANTKIISQSLDEGYKLLSKSFSHLVV